MKEMICKVVSQTPKEVITTKEGNQMSKCNIRLKCVGGPFADEFWCSIFGPQADLVFLSGEIVAVALRHSVSGNNGNIFNDVTVSGIEKL